MSYLSELLENLKKPVPVQWRVQTVNKDKTKATCSAFIDAREVSEILDKYCAFGWESSVKEVAGFIFYGIGITLDTGQTIWRWDTGSRIEDDKEDNMYENAGKSAASDAFKRAAVQFGVGKFTYDLPMVTLPCNQYRKVVDPKTGDTVWDLTKYINDLQKSGPKPKANTPEPAAKVEQAKEVAPQPTEEKVDFVGPKEKLSKDKFEAMSKAIQNGQAEAVKSAMDKYEMTLQQKTVLTTLINQNKPK